MLQNLLKFAKFQKFQLENLVDFEKCCKTHIFLQKSEPIQPKTSNILPKFCQPTLSDEGAVMGRAPLRRTIFANRESSVLLLEAPDTCHWVNLINNLDPESDQSSIPEELKFREALEGLLSASSSTASFYLTSSFQRSKLNISENIVELEKC